jgi:ribosomal protein L4
VVLADMPIMGAPKTRDIVSFLGALELQGKTLILTDGMNDTLYRSSRNLGTVSVLPFGEESVYDVLWANTVVIEKSALDDDTEKPKKKKAKVKAATEETVVEEAEAAASDTDSETEEKPDA